MNDGRRDWCLRCSICGVLPCVGSTGLKSTEGPETRRTAVQELPQREVSGSAPAMVSALQVLSFLGSPLGAGWEGGERGRHQMLDVLHKSSSIEVFGDVALCYTHMGTPAHSSCPGVLTVPQGAHYSHTLPWTAFSQCTGALRALVTH